MSILSKGIGKDPINTQEPFTNEQELRENLNMQSPPPSEAPNDWKSNTLDMGSLSPSIGARALGGLIRKAIDFVPNTFDPDNENRNLALAGLSFLGPNNFRTGQSAWNAGVGSLQATFDEQAKTDRETSRQENQLAQERLSQGAQDARAADKRKFDKDQNQRNRDSREGIARDNREVEGTLLKLRMAANKQQQDQDRALEFVKEAYKADKDHAKYLTDLIAAGTIPGTDSGIDLATRDALFRSRIEVLEFVKNHDFGDVYTKETKPNFEALISALEKAQYEGTPYTDSGIVATLVDVYEEHVESLVD